MGSKARDLADLPQGDGDLTVDGNVGIGTSSPGAKLDIADATQATGAVMRLSNTASSSTWVAGNVLGQIDFHSTDGSFPGTKAQIKAFADTGNGSVGVNYSAMSFSTMKNGSFAERMRIDSDGRVTMPYQPAFQAYMGVGNYSTETNSDEPNLNATRFNIGNHYNTGSRRFTAPVDGTYFFTGTSNCYGIGTGSKIRNDLYINNSSHLYGVYFVVGDSGDHTATVSCVVRLAAGDTAHLVNYSDDAVRTYSGDAQWNNFSGCLIG